MDPTLPGRLRGLYGIVSPAGARDAEARRGEVTRVAAALLDGGSPVVQLRVKEADGRELLALAHELRRMTRSAGALFIVNDRVDVALLASADGVHVGQEDLPVAEVRRVARSVLGPTAPFLVGLSTHDLAQVEDALSQGADYLGFGPVFATATKADALPARGPGLLGEAVQLAARVPVVAIGGLALENAAEVARSGAAMGAVISDVARAADPRRRAAELHRVLLGRES